MDSTKPIVIVVEGSIKGRLVICARKEKTELNDNNLAVAYYLLSSILQREASIK